MKSALPQQACRSGHLAAPALDCPRNRASKFSHRIEKMNNVDSEPSLGAFNEAQTRTFEPFATIWIVFTGVRTALQLRDLARPAR